MTAFANDASAANLWVLGPMIWRNLPGVHGHDQAFRSAHASEERFDFLDLRSKATVETHHQQRGRGPRVCRCISLDDLLQLLRCQSQRFFDKDMLSRLQSATHEGCVAVVTRRDYHN